MYRFKFISNIFKNLLNENEEIIAQKVDALKINVNRKCSNESCNKIYHSLKRKCEACGSPVIKNTEEIQCNINSITCVDPNKIDIGQVSSENKPVIKMFEPVLVNPNSYKNVEIILKEIKEKAINGDRKWVFVGCFTRTWSWSHAHEPNENTISNFG